MASLTSQQVRECYERAATARRQAEAGRTLAEREEWRATEQRWMRLARLYKLQGEVMGFLDRPTSEVEPAEVRGTLAPSVVPASLLARADEAIE